MSTESKSIQNYFLMTIVIIVWGVSWPIGRIVATSNVGQYPFTISFLRYLFAIPFLVIFTKLIEKKIIFRRDLMGKVIILGFLQISLYQIFFLLGVRYTSSSDAVLIITGGISFITAFLSAKMYIEEKMTKYRLIGILLAFSGVFLVFLFSPNQDVENRLLGNFLIVLAALVFAIYTVYSKPIYKEYTPLNFQIWATLFGWIILTIFSIGEQVVAQEFVLLQFDADIIWWIFFLGVVSAAIGNTLYSVGVKNIGPTRSSLFINFMPIAGVISAAIMLGERITIIYPISFAIIFLGIYIEKTKN